MNADKPFNRLNRSTAILAVTMLALTAAASSAALADPPSKLSTDTRSAAVSTTDLDLSTPEGLSAARERVRQVVRQLCKRVANPEDLSRESNYAACVAESFTNAMAKLKERAAAVVARSDAE